MSKIYDGKQLPDVMHKWQHVLHLDAWDIRIKLCRQSEMLDPNVQGENNWTLATRQSVIHVLDPVDYPADTEFEQDMEQTVVHELLHLHFAPFEPEDDMGIAYLAMEQTIELLARVLTGKNCDACSCKPDIEKIAHGIVEQLTLPTAEAGGFLVRQPLHRLRRIGVLHDFPKREFPCVPRY